MRRHPNYFNVNKHVKICSEHFRPEDFINPEAKKRRLKRDVVPSIFAWSEESPETVARSAVEKLNTSRQEEEEATDTASKGEGEETFTLSGLTKEEKLFTHFIGFNSYVD